MSDREAWRPCILIEHDKWLGTVGEQWWIGTRDRRRACVENDAPLGLLPLLEQPLSEVETRLLGPWQLPKHFAPAAIVELGLVSNDYWASCALNWIEQKVPDFERWDLVEALTKSRSVTQSTRHHAWRLVKHRLREPR